MESCACAYIVFHTNAAFTDKPSGLIAHCHQPKKPGFRPVVNELVAAEPERTLFKVNAGRRPSSAPPRAIRG
jgi:hypothetical protein